MTSVSVTDQSVNHVQKKESQVIMSIILPSSMPLVFIGQKIKIPNFKFQQDLTILVKMMDVPLRSYRP